MKFEIFFFVFTGVGTEIIELFKNNMKKVSESYRLFFFLYKPFDDSLRRHVIS